MKERPILFKGEMVRALLAGSKTQTRRLVKRQPWASCSIEEGSEGESPFVYSALHGAGPGHDVEESRTPCVCPYGLPGDRLWVRESWAQRGSWRLPAWPDADADDAYWSGTKDVIYTASTEKPAQGWRGRPSIHMPRWASRILLEIVSVRVERLNDCSEADAIAEGVGALFSPVALYSQLWESINGAGSWAANPWVWVVEFKRVTP